MKLVNFILLVPTNFLKSDHFFKIDNQKVAEKQNKMKRTNFSFYKFKKYTQNTLKVV